MNNVAGCMRVGMLTMVCRCRWTQRVQSPARMIVQFFHTRLEGLLQSCKHRISLRPCATHRSVASPHARVCWLLCCSPRLRSARACHPHRTRGQRSRKRVRRAVLCSALRRCFLYLRTTRPDLSPPRASPPPHCTGVCAAVRREGWVGLAAEISRIDFLEIPRNELARVGADLCT